MASPGQKVVLITGCSSGIGLRMAVMLAKDEQKRYHVIATMRDLKRKDKLVEAAGDTYGKTLSLAVLDVCNDESVKQCIDGIKDRHVDVLINNAGIGLVGPVESIPIEEMKKVFETNFFGVIRMIKEVMPDMKKRRGGHIIVVSSVMGLNEKRSDVLSLIEPGPVHTEFEVKMIEEVKKRECPGADPDTVHYFKDVYLPSSLDIFEALGQTPDDIAKCTKKVIEASSPRFRNLTNPLYSPIVAMKYADETGSLSIHAFYHMLFNMGSLMHVSITAMKYLTCGCLRSRTISPN
uniref:Retinol dehydrogenase 8b n=1 Tax=Neogobius melanostomus TaxID=47308 RepID=A0A8C6SRQ5_9GOBI